MYFMSVTETFLQIGDLNKNRQISMEKGMNRNSVAVMMPYYKPSMLPSEPRFLL